MIKKFNQFINVNWEEIEEVCANTKGLPDCVPQNIRQWQTFIKQYERASDLVNGTWEPHYNWNTEEEFNQAVNEQFYLAKGFKHSIYECLEDLLTRQQILFKNVDWEIIECANRFTKWYIDISSKSFKKLPLLPKIVGESFFCDNNNLISLEGAPNHVGGNFYCDNNQLISLEGAPNYVGRDFNCFRNKLTSLKGAPNYVGASFICTNNKLTSLEGAPNHVSKNFNCCRNNLTSLEGAPNHVGADFKCDNNKLTSLKGPNRIDGSFHCLYNKLPKSIPSEFPGKHLPKYIDYD